MKFPAPIRLATFVLMLVGIVLSAPAIAQKLGPDGAPNPTASVIDQLVREYEWILPQLAARALL